MNGWMIAVRMIAVASALGYTLPEPIRAESTVRSYAVELFDPTGRLMATGRVTVALTPSDEFESAHRIDGHYGFDRSGPGTPPLEEEGGRVHGITLGDRVRLSLAVFPFERVEIEARFLDADRDRLAGDWRYSACFRFARGYIRALALDPRDS